MQDEETVYADWTALRLAVPAAIGLLLVAIVAIIGIRAATSEPELTSEPTAEAADEEALADLGIEEPTTPEEALSRFAERLPDGRFEGLTFAFNDPADADADWAAVTANLGAFELVATPGPVSSVDAANATAPMRIDWTLEDGTVFETTGDVDLVLVGTEWQVDWEPSVLEASLDPGDSLVQERVSVPRAPILGRNGVALVDNRPTWIVGVVPRRSDDIEATSQALGQLLRLDPAEIQATIAPNPSDAFVPIASSRVEDLAGIEANLRAIPGVVLQSSTYPLPINERFARALLGRSAEVTAEIIEEAPDLFAVGDVAGRSGLQRLYNRELTGAPGFQIRVDRRFPAQTTGVTTTTEADGAGEDGGGTGMVDLGNNLVVGPDGVVSSTDPDVVYLDPPVPGTPLQLTIDERVQTAAENALTGTPLASALVAVEVSTGHVLAVANGPGVAFDNFAMNGQYPPGSIFKIVTAYGALAKGVQLNDPVDCPFSLNVNGRDFTNAEGEVLGIVPVREAFVFSCNTAFISIGNVLDPSEFPATAAALGIGVPYDLGVAAYSGSVPAPGGAVDRAATAFGQGQTLMSPLSAAVMAASIAGGTYRPPVLIVDSAAEPQPDQPLDPRVAEDMRQAMRAVVTNGTGRAVAGVPGGPVSGKTGTAEFGDQVPPQAHAWFVGFQGDLAFAVFVEAGEFGGATAAPIAGAFLSQLAG